MKCLAPRSAAAALVAAFLVTAIACSPQQTESSAERRDQPTTPTTGIRLYVFDCGTLQVDPARFGLKREEVATTALSAACFLVTHPKGRLIWDPGAVPDGDWTPTGAEVAHRVVLPDGATRDVKLRKRLVPQLAEAGYVPADITHLAFSHYHYDHTANANAFAGATWLVRKVERDAMFAEKPPSIAQPSSYSALKDSKATIIDSDEHDVFGDGTVILKLAAGHTPGHQVLFVKLPKTGAIVLSGDLYHFPEQRALKRVAVFDVDQAQTPISRDAVDAFLAKTGAQLWIQHDDIANAKLKKAPEYYE
jgi:N-acyl homoserine lactone hydrolase